MFGESQEDELQELDRIIEHIDHYHEDPVSFNMNFDTYRENPRTFDLFYRSHDTLNTDLHRRIGRDAWRSHRVAHIEQHARNFPITFTSLLHNFPTYLNPNPDMEIRVTLNFSKILWFERWNCLSRQTPLRNQFSPGSLEYILFMLLRSFTPSRFVRVREGQNDEDDELQYKDHELKDGRELSLTVRFHYDSEMWRSTQENNQEAELPRIFDQNLQGDDLLNEHTAYLENFINEFKTYLSSQTNIILTERTPIESDHPDSFFEDVAHRYLSVTYEIRPDITAI